MLSQVESLIAVNNGIKSITSATDFEQAFRRSFWETGSLAKPWEQLWRDTAKVSSEITLLLEKLEEILKAIQGDNQGVAKEDATIEADDQGSEKWSVRPPFLKAVVQTKALSTFHFDVRIRSSC